MIEHSDLVHHMLLYRCPSFVTQVYDKPCYMGDVGDACYSVVAGWGLGGGVRQRPFFSRSVGHVAVFVWFLLCNVHHRCCLCVSIVPLNPGSAGIPAS